MLRPAARLTALFVLALSLSWAFSAAFAAGCPSAERGPGPEFKRVLARLDLTEEQSTQIKEVFADSKAKSPALRKEMMRLEHALHGELLEDRPDAGKIHKIVSQIGELRTQAQIARLDCRLAIRKILTPEQRDRLLLMGPRMGCGGMMGSEMGCMGDRHGSPGCHGDCGCGGHPCHGRSGRDCGHAGRGCGPADPGCGQPCHHGAGRPGPGDGPGDGPGGPGGKHHGRK